MGKIWAIILLKWLIFISLANNFKKMKKSRNRINTGFCDNFGTNKKSAANGNRTFQLCSTNRIKWVFVNFCGQLWAIFFNERVNIVRHLDFCLVHIHCMLIDSFHDGISFPSTKGLNLFV